jgi:SET domain-containing protein
VKDLLHNCGRLEVRQSKLEGWGVFAREDISAGEILEEIPFVLFPRSTGLGKAVYNFLHEQQWISEAETNIESLRKNLKFKDPEKYYFKWSPPEPMIDGRLAQWTVLPLGFGPIYNTDNTDNNAGWKIADDLFIFSAEKDIKKDEEIKTFYGYFVSEEGSIFNVEEVFHMGLNLVNGKARCEALRYASPEHVGAVNQNEGYKELLQMALKKAELVNIKTGQYDFEFPENYPISFYYKKLKEFKSSRFPTTDITLSYKKENGKSTTKVITVPNR